MAIIISAGFFFIYTIIYCGRPGRTLPLGRFIRYCKIPAPYSIKYLFICLRGREYNGKKIILKGDAFKNSIKD